MGIQINQSVPKEVQFAVSQILSALPYYLTTAYVNSCDKGADLALRGLSTLNQDTTYRIRIHEVQDGYVYNVPFETIHLLLELVIPKSDMIDSEWIHIAQTFEEQNKNRFWAELQILMYFVANMGYVSSVVQSETELRDADIEALSDVVRSMTMSLMTYNVQDNAFLSLLNLSQAFNNELSRNILNPTHFGQWLTLVKNVYKYLIGDNKYTGNLQQFGDNYVWNITVAGVTNQDITMHRNIPYPLYTIGLDMIISLLSSVKNDFVDVLIIDPYDGEVAYDVKTLGVQANEVIKKCCCFADSGNGIVLRIMFKPTRKVVYGR